MSYRYVVLRMALEKYCFDKIAIMGKKGGKREKETSFSSKFIILS